VLGLVVAPMISGVVSNVQTALIGCLLMGLLGCVDFNSAYRCINWKSLVLIVGMLPFSLALQRTGGGDLAADAVLVRPRHHQESVLALAEVGGVERWPIPSPRGPTISSRVFLWGSYGIISQGAVSGRLILSKICIANLLKRLGPLLRMFAEVYDLRRQLLQRHGLLLPIFTEVYAKRDVVDPMDHHSTK
jgi:hypothetical protein